MNAGRYLRVRCPVADAGRYAEQLLTSCARMVLALCLLAMLPAYAAQPIDLGADVLAKVTKTPVRKFSTGDFGREQYDGAINVLVSNQKAFMLLKTLRKQLPPGLVAFLGTTDILAEPPAKGTEIVVAPGKDQFDILRVATSSCAPQRIFRSLQEVATSLIRIAVLMKLVSPCDTSSSTKGYFR